MNEIDTSIIIAICSIGALIVSIIALVSNSKTSKRTSNLESDKHDWEIEWEHSKELMRQNDVANQTRDFWSNNRITFIPYFHLVESDKIYTEKRSDQEYIIIPISIKNIGKETATNIHLKSYSKDNPLDNYFRVDYLDINNHYINDYMDKQYATFDDIVNFTVICKKHNEGYNVHFKINFTDLIGREYEQNFRFQYDYTTMSRISLNQTSSIPLCIDDTDKTTKKVL